MAIIGVGTDILRVSRLSALVHRRGAQKLALRILSTPELHEFKALGDHQKELMFLGVRWASKEALYKATFPVLRLAWKDVTVYKQGRKPYVRLEKHQSSRSVGRVHLSVSHDDDFILAFAVVEETE